MPPPPAEHAPAASAEQQASKPQVASRKRLCCKYTLAALPLLLALLVYHVPTIVEEYRAYYGYGDAPMFELPPGVMDVFRVYDQDGDGFIDPYEFVVLGMRLREQVYNLYI